MAKFKRYVALFMTTVLAVTSVNLPSGSMRGIT
jgi:hypothetical protein